jgi:CRISPR-associated helicase Cas3/CRISPR-associated endonuclease Cas3-HD
MTSEVPYFAHSENDHAIRHKLSEHLTSVGALAGGFAADQPWHEEAEFAGLLHDLGKYGDLFQARLKGTESGLDHWSAGALAALQRYGMVGAALAIEGHHIGLQCAAPHQHAQRMKMVRGGDSPQGHHIRLSDTDIDRLLNRAAGDGVRPIKPESVVLSVRQDAWAHAIARMLDVRILFSCLVDADYLDTEAHFNGGLEGKRYREPGLMLDAARAALALEHHMAEAVRGQRQSSDDVSTVRAKLWMAVSEAATLPVGTFSLTAPTGSGKTLAMLQFALAHARRHDLKRIILVVPYLSIIEQTAKIYRKVFADEPDQFVLEHHSLAGVGVEQSGPADHDDKERQRRLHSENWDAPIILTTNVQLLESLFSNRPSACRKLHRLHDAVILFDEAQSLPQHLSVPTLAALSHLASAYNTSVVFATATQPAFDTLDTAVRKYAASGWKPREIVPGNADMFQRLERVKACWPEKDESLSWDELATTLRCDASAQVLCILNLKRHAQALLQSMEGTEGLFHLSTNLCSAHRRAVLDEVRIRLDPAKPMPCRLVSTQCVEAGVDLDFPLVYRAMAPLEAVAQAAGRCNREGRLNQYGTLGQVRVFEPVLDTSKREHMFPNFAYFQATEVTVSLLRECHGKLDINDPAVFRRYYQSLYGVSRLVDQNQDLTNAITGLDFPEIARRYKLIDQDAIQVLVPWSPRIDLYRRLRKQAAVGIDSKWMREAQTLSVSIYRPKRDHPAWGSLVAARFRRGGESEEWFVLEDPEGKFYDNTLGLQLPQNQQVMIA